jgi:hypothetical protein
MEVVDRNVNRIEERSWSWKIGMSREKYRSGDIKEKERHKVTKR